jgi:hypothetical protein
MPLRSRPPRGGGVLAELPDASGVTGPVADGVGFGVGSGFAGSRAGARTDAGATGWDTFLDSLERDLAETMFDVMADSGSASASDSNLSPDSGSGLNSNLNPDSDLNPDSKSDSPPAPDPYAAPGVGRALTVSQVWVPPVGLGPLPARLEGRARALVAATADARAELAALHLEVGRHLAAVQSVPPAVGSRPPVYLDVAG